MPITSVASYNTLIESLHSAVADKANVLYRKYINGTISVYDKIIFILLRRYVKMVEDTKVYETYDSTILYEAGDFVVSGTDYYLCTTTLTGAGILLSNRDYWSKHISFTYDYDTLVDTLGYINRICNTTFVI